MIFNRQDLESIVFLLALWIVIFGDVAMSAARHWWRRRVERRAE